MFFQNEVLSIRPAGAINYSLLIWSSCSTPPLAPVTGQKELAVWAARSGVNTAREPKAGNYLLGKGSKMKTASDHAIGLRKMQHDKAAASPPKTNQDEETCYKVDG